MSETIDLLGRGGLVMVVIGISSVIALATFIERLWSLRTVVVIPDAFVRELRERLRQGTHRDALAACARADCPAARVASAGLEHAGGQRSDARAALEDAGRREVSRLERYTGILGNIATVTPLLGLLGTIIGMIRTFRQVNESAAATGFVSPADMASGIWQALITTAAGLCVAIPAFLAHRMLLARVDAHALALEELAAEVLDQLFPPGADS